MKRDFKKKLSCVTRQVCSAHYSEEAFINTDHYFWICSPISDHVIFSLRKIYCHFSQPTDGTKITNGAFKTQQLVRMNVLLEVLIY